MTKLQKNLLKLPIVLLLRAPIMLAVNILLLVGTVAERIGFLAETYLPGWEK
jgi:hypothetical protein